MTHARAVWPESWPTYGKTFNGTLPGKPSLNFDEDLRRPENLLIHSLVFDTLYRLSESGVQNILPHIATAPPLYEKDYMSARVPLKKKILAHDGRAIDPNHIARELTRLGKNTSGGLQWVDEISWDEMTDELVFKFRYRMDDLEYRLARPENAIKFGGKNQLIGSGPFRMVSHFRGHVSKRAEELRLEHFELHHAGRPFLSSAILKWFLNPLNEKTAFANDYLQASREGKAPFLNHEPRYEYRRSKAKMPSSLFLTLKSNEASKMHHAIIRTLTMLIDARALKGRHASGLVVNESIFQHVSGLTRWQKRALHKAMKIRDKRHKEIFEELKQRGVRVGFRPSKSLHRIIAERIVFQLHRAGINVVLFEIENHTEVAHENRAPLVLHIDEWVFSKRNIDLLMTEFYAAGDESFSEVNKTKIATWIARLKSRVPVIPLVMFYPVLVIRKDVYGLEAGCINCLADTHFYKTPHLIDSK